MLNIWVWRNVLSWRCGFGDHLCDCFLSLIHYIRSKFLKALPPKLVLNPLIFLHFHKCTWCSSLSSLIWTRALTDHSYHLPVSPFSSVEYILHTTEWNFLKESMVKWLPFSFSQQFPIKHRMKFNFQVWFTRPTFTRQTFWSLPSNILLQHIWSSSTDSFIQQIFM